jgi:hypothetical protein
MGFGAHIKTDKENTLGELFKQLEPDDLIHYGLIPELVGRLPVAVALEELDEQALLKILTQPKNALVKQFKKLFELDGIELGPLLMVVHYFLLKHLFSLVSLNKILDPHSTKCLVLHSLLYYKDHLSLCY